MKLHNVYLN